MRKMKCRNGLVWQGRRARLVWQARLAAAELVWQGRRARFVFVAAIGLGLMVTSARGGSLDAPAGPNSAASAMYTLEDIYNCMDTRTNVIKRTGAFREPTAGPTVGTMHTLNDIMDLLVRRVGAASKTGQTPTVPFYTPNPATSDGNLQKGVAWPTQRFTAVATSGDETNQIRDNLTGLIWARNANIAGSKTWTNAFDAITNLISGVVNKVNYGGTNDWRLPNVNELHSLIAWQYASPALSDGTGTNQWTADLGPFADVSLNYWSSSTYAGSTGDAWRVVLSNGGVSSASKTTAYSVWPVRGGQ